MSKRDWAAGIQIPIVWIQSACMPLAYYFMFKIIKFQWVFQHRNRWIHRRLPELIWRPVGSLVLLICIWIKFRIWLESWHSRADWNATIQMPLGKIQQILYFSLRKLYLHAVRFYTLYFYISNQIIFKLSLWIKRWTVNQTKN